MNKSEILKRVETANFKQLNGKILRFINMMGRGERRIGNIYRLVEDSGFSQDCIKSSFAYLETSGYILIDHADGADCISDNFNSLEIKVSITAKGYELLHGITSNPAVEV